MFWRLVFFLAVYRVLRFFSRSKELSDDVSVFQKDALVEEAGHGWSLAGLWWGVHGTDEL